MKALYPGHLYQLDSMEGTNPQQIQFIEKQPNNEGQLVTVNDGTTNEEVVKMLLDRLQTLYTKLPSNETKNAAYHLEQALWWLELRTAKRLAQGVENTPLPHKSEGE